MGYEIDFLPVGDDKGGDAIAVRFGDLMGPRTSQFVVVIDGGYRETGSDLANHIRTFYGTDTVDLVISTHPDGDHVGGLHVLLEQMKVGALWMHQPWNHTDDIARMFRDGRVTDASVRESLRRSLEQARDLEMLARRKGISIVEPFVGLADPTGCLVVAGPSQAFYESLLPGFRGTPEPRSVGAWEAIFRGAKETIERIAETWDVETLDDTGETTAENNSSTILLLRVDGQSALFTADAGIPALTQAIELLQIAGFEFSNLNFIQVPHHGSRRNVGPSILDWILGPRLPIDSVLKVAFVSAPKNGAPKHPAKKVVNAFRRRGAPVHATQGQCKRQAHDAPSRPGWVASTPLPFYHEVEE